MKRKMTLVLTLLLAAVLCGCSQTASTPAAATFDTPLKQQMENQEQPLSDIYLTADTFFYATEDTNQSNTFGTPQKLMAYNLLTGKTKTVLDGVGDVSQLCRIGDILYFTCYDYTVQNRALWGYCLYAYDLNKAHISQVYATPNTVDGVQLAPCGAQLFYLCNTRDQDGLNQDKSGGGQLHCLTAAQDRVLKSGFDSDGSALFSRSDKGTYFLCNLPVDSDKQDQTAQYYFVDTDGKYTLTKKHPKHSDTDYRNSTPSARAVTVADYQNYAIEMTCTVPYKPKDTDCGYRYIARYVLKEKATGKSYTLPQGAYWYYYI